MTVLSVEDVALTLWQHGPQAAWLAISQQAGDLRAQALDFVQQQVLAVAAKAVPLFLASLAVPGGAFLQVARGLYNGVLLFVEKGRQLAQVGQALFASASAIAAGQLAPAAQAVENTLVKILPVALAFLARQLGLDGISGAIQTGLKKVQAPVEKAVNKVLDTVAQKANAIWDAVKAGAGKALDRGKEVATAVGTTVKGWLGLNHAFTSGKELHHVYVEEKGGTPELMVASDPLPYETFLAQLHFPTPTPVEVTKTKREVVKTVGAVNVLLQAQSTFLQQQAQPTVRIDRRDQRAIDYSADIHRKLERLALLTANLMPFHGAAALSAGTPTPVQPDTPPLFSGTEPGGFGRGVLVEYLNASTVHGQLLSSGTEPKVAPTAAFKELRRRQTPNGYPYYMRGHLLSMHLNGKGDTWVNLTPLSREGNKQHERDVEGPLKTAAASLAPAANRAFYYSVVPRYGRPLNQALLGLLNPASARDRVLEKVIRAEAHVPLSLTCMVREIDPATRKPTAGLHLNLTIPNPIEQESLADYLVGGNSPTLKVNEDSKVNDWEELGMDKHDAQILIAAAQRKPFTKWSDVLALSVHSAPADWQDTITRLRKRKEIRLN